ncbi:MAG: bifunctional 3-deoxy-7-phosphoheptulonate synthase/chorismate mutase type II [Bacteroidia bacterium]|nr:bifunctional 3-deoxy-7-phosphoheptulonate synthase/chorismate mutase type II [Bacteroidia bacterium]
MEFIPMSKWELGLDDFSVIAGPCSAETPEQVMETALGVAQQGAKMLRAGIWKPRTRPNSFEGVGSPGLKWLKEAGDATGLPVCTEVANVKHVYEALRTGIDVLWLGARTTTNPFAVQEIADALEGVDIPVMVKNPVNPDIDLWIGAMERIEKAGITKIAAIHRGFSTYGPSKYRNAPHWEIPVELRRRLPDVPIICDPSHICGRRDLLSAISQEALDLNLDGLMIESHPNPDKALSDAKQQITPEVLGELLAGLIHREAVSNDPIFLHSLENFRDQIDEFDRKLIEVIAERMKVVRQIGEYKRDNNITILQTSRWNQIIDERMEQARSLGLGEAIMREILGQVHQESIRQQTEVMNNQIEKH